MPKQKSQYAIDECSLNNLLKKLSKEKNLVRKSKIFHALSEHVRIKILNALSIRPLCVCVLTEITKMKYSKLSYHLSILKETGLITWKEDGNWLIYRLTPFGKRTLEIVRTKF